MCSDQQREITFGSESIAEKKFLVTLSRVAAGIGFLIRQGPRLPVVIIILFVLSALIPGLLSPMSPTSTSLSDRFLPPLGFENAILTHPLGTDSLGRDLLSRVIFGARVSLGIAAATIALGGGIGITLGILAGYKGGHLERIIMRAVDATVAFPVILLALLFAVVYGPSWLNIVVVLSLLLWARYARLVRGEVLAWKNRDFIALAIVAGASPFRIITRHILPNILNSIVVFTTLEIGWVILAEASLSFLGAGVPPPMPAWGSMVAAGRDVTREAWWVSLVPGLAIVLNVLALNIFGDWLRDTLDPRLRHI